jgi:hypothetical protein
MSFCLRTPKLGFEVVEIATFGILEACIFLCKPSIEVRSQAKFYPSSRTFQQHVAQNLHTHILGRFLNFRV